MWHCYRGADFDYRIGYAESADGETWTRRDDHALTLLPDGAHWLLGLADREPIKLQIDQALDGVFGQVAVGVEVADVLRRVRLLDRRTSGDTAGDSQRVVGYGSFALYARD